MHSHKELVIMSEGDNIGIIKNQVKEGGQITIAEGDGENVVKVRQDIAFGFKIAVKDISRGGKIYKYGEPIGIASMDISKGDMVHIHNMEGFRGRGDLNDSR
ncbi:MAG: UxaA family hydrolase [Desulfobacterales bacterium]